MRPPSQSIAGHGGTQPNIPGVPEAEIGRIMILGQWLPISMERKLGMVACTCHPSYSGKCKKKKKSEILGGGSRRITNSRPALGSIFQLG
jgi:hypothetical protein